MNATQRSSRVDLLRRRGESTPRARAGYLDQACGGDAELRARVEALLDAHQKADSFLEPARPPTVTVRSTAVRRRPGTVIGPYKLLEQIGEGGMGLVYMAEQHAPAAPAWWP